MEIMFFGADETVTGSKTLLKLAGKNILVDCGLFQGGKKLEKRNLEHIQFTVSALDYVFITHGHLDHCGYLPVLFQQGFKGKIYCTHLTQEIIKIILDDAVKVQENDLKEKKIEKALYNELDVMKVMENFQTFEKDKDYKVGKIQFRFYEAGHILGASSIEFQFENKSICFSGDLGRADDYLHYPPTFPTQADFLVLESTYGNRDHPKVDPIELILRHIKRIKQSGGVLLIPAFAVARTQIVLKILAEVFEKYPESELPVFVDSPMASKVTKLYLENHEALKLNKEQMLDFLSHAQFLDFGKDQKKFAKRKGPYILVASSGMISGGKVLKYFDMFAKHEMNTILLVGYQGEGTIGRRILEGEDKIKLMGHIVDVRAEVDYLEGLSAHADRVELKTYVKNIQGLKAIYLNHGEKETLSDFQNFLSDLGIEIIIANKNKKYSLES